ncbi:MAG: nitroreductase family protein, partial [Dehalococcoidia bacterium]
LDFSRPVPREVIEQCLAIAQQAPTGGNVQNWSFVVVTDPAKRNAIAELYRKVWQNYLTAPGSAANLRFDDPARNAVQVRVTASAQYLADHLHEVLVHVIPCLLGRADNAPPPAQAGRYASIFPAAWSFMLAARARGLGTAWTSLHLFYEEQAAAILDIPYAEVQQTALIPVAYTKGTDFKPAPRDPLSKIVHWDRW